MEILDQSELRDNGKPLETVLSEGYTFNLGDYIGRGFKLFGKDAGSYIGFVLLFLVINVVIGFIPFIGTIASLFVNPALLAGWFIYTRLKQKNQASFGNFFDGFRGPHWMQLVLASIVTAIFIGIVVAAIVLPLFFSVIIDFVSGISDMQGMRDPDDMRGIMMAMFTGKILLMILVAILAGSLISVLYCLTPMFIIFRKMGFWDAMEASRKVVSKNYFQFFIFFVLLMIILLVGYAMCCIGLLVAIPVYYLSLYAAYEDIMGMGDETTSVS